MKCVSSELIIFCITTISYKQITALNVEFTALIDTKHGRLLHMTPACIGHTHRRKNRYYSDYLTSHNAVQQCELNTSRHAISHTSVFSFTCK